MGGLLLEDGRDFILYQVGKCLLALAVMGVWQGHFMYCKELHIVSNVHANCR